jgi:hypothetical protein
VTTATVAAATVTVVTLQPSHAAAGLIRDGAFAAPAVPPGGQFAEFCTSKSLTPYCDTANARLGAWHIDGGSVDLIPAGQYQPPPKANAKTQLVDMNGSGPGSIGQVISTAPGASYTVSFELAGNTVCGPTIKTLWVEAENKTAGKYTFNMNLASASQMRWVRKSLTFIASTSATELRFISETPDSYCGPIITDISVIGS